MKAIVCEMCSSNNVVKKDGVFECQNCGTKYSVEEAKKLMIEGPVDVSGSTVKIDSSDELNNLYQIARRAKNDNNRENAAKYYDMIAMKDPTSWEAAFFSVYFRSKSTNLANSQSASISVSNMQQSVMTLIKDYVPEEEQSFAVDEVMDRSVEFSNSFANWAKDHYDDISPNIKDNYTQEFIDRFCAARDISYECGDQIEKIFGSKRDIAKMAVDAWKAGIELHKRIIPYLANKVKNEQIIASYTNKIAKYDDDYNKAYQAEKINERISQLQKRLFELKNPSSFSELADEKIAKYIFLGVVCILVFIAVILPAIKVCQFNPSIGIIFIVVALIFAVMGVVLFLICKKKHAENTKKHVLRESQINSIESQIAKLKRELRDL